MSTSNTGAELRLKDPICGLVRALTSAHGRNAHNAYIIDDLELIRRAFDYGAPVSSLLVAPDTLAREPDLHAAAACSSGCAVYTARSSGLLAKLTQNRRSRVDAVAVVDRKHAGLPLDSSLVLVAEDVVHTSNLGMLLRSAEATQVPVVLAGEKAADPTDRAALRASRGAVFHLPIHRARSATRALEELAQAGFSIVVTSANQGLTHTDINLRGPTALVVGNETTGVSEGVHALARACARIPMAGRINSLNVAVAASLMVFEALRQRAV